MVHGSSEFMPCPPRKQLSQVGGGVASTAVLDALVCDYAEIVFAVHGAAASATI